MIVLRLCQEACEKRPEKESVQFRISGRHDVIKRKLLNSTDPKGFITASSSHHHLTMAETSQCSSLDNPYTKNMIEQIAHCHQLHEALSSQIRPLSQAEQQAAYDVACLEWQQPDKPNGLPTDPNLQKEFFERCQTMFSSNPTTTKE